MTNSKSITASAMVLFMVFSSGMASAGSGGHTDTKTAKNTTFVVNCGSVYTSLKNNMKTAARGHCADIHGSTGGNKLKKENFTKLSCQTKYGNPNIYTATGKLYYECK